MTKGNNLFLAKDIHHEALEDSRNFYLFLLPYALVPFCASSWPLKSMLIRGYILSANYSPANIKICVTCVISV